jgi:hypothetical protein
MKPLPGRATGSTVGVTPIAARILSMTAPIQSIERAGDELADIHSEVRRLEKRIERVRHTVREAVTELSIPDARDNSPMRGQTAVSHFRWNGHPMKTNPELTANVQAVLNLETKKEADRFRRASLAENEHKRRRQSLMPNPSRQAANLFSLWPKRRFCPSPQRMKPPRNQAGVPLVPA